MRRFPLHYCSVFLSYLLLAPTVVLTSAEMYSDFVAQPHDWFRIHLVALIVSVIVGLPIFFMTLDLFGHALGTVKLPRPHVTIGTKVFLIGARFPYLSIPCWCSITGPERAENEAELLGPNVHNLIHRSPADGGSQPKHDRTALGIVPIRDTRHGDDHVHWRRNGSSSPVEYWTHPIYRDGEQRMALLIDDLLSLSRSTRAPVSFSNYPLTGRLCVTRSR